MFDALIDVEHRYEELNMRISDPAIMSNQDEYRKLLKEHANLEVLVVEYRKYKKLKEDLQGIREMLDANADREFKDMAELEQDVLEKALAASEETIKEMLQPKDPKDDANVIIEIRAGAGGEEAALFAASLFRAYSMYSDKRGWRTEIMDSNPTEIGGFKEVVFSIEGTGAYSRFKFESGVHRVQRVPDTESSGRIHTSTVTVAVLPEVEDVGEIEILPGDIEIDTYRASGAGGQHINKTESAIRITHKATGIVVTCQDQRSQHKNKDKAMNALRSKLYAKALEESTSEYAENRKSQVGTGDRSERIRTYNFPQGRVTDHRIGLTLYKIDDVMNGDLDDYFDALNTSFRAGKLGAGTSEDD